jgi:competence protein ComEA
VFLVGAFGIALVLVVTILWPKATDEGFAVATAAEKTAEGDSESDSSANPDTASDALTSKEQVDALSTGAMQAADTVPLIIYLTGTVINPGVYELRQGARLNDVVALAGGLAEGSAASYINLAMPLQDGQHVHIPSQVEVESGEAARIEAGGAVGSAGVSGATASSSAGLSQSEQKVNINTADNAQLESLPGIGVATAQRIIDYRKKNGNFGSIEELKNVSGIGEKKYEELVDKVCV